MNNVTNSTTKSNKGKNSSTLNSYFSSNSTSSGNLNSISTSIGSASNVTYTPYTTNLATISTGYFDSTYSISENFLNLVITYMTEDEIRSILDKIVSRITSDDEYVIQNAMRVLIDNQRIFSEDFVLDYMNYIDTSLIQRKYKSYIKSGQYKKLALYFEANK